MEIKHTSCSKCKKNLGKLKNYTLYGYRNNINGKYYIGQTCCSMKERSGKNGSRYLRKKKNGGFIHHKFASAILKYGWENFSLEIFGEFSSGNIDLAERNMIKEKDSFINGYNETDGGQGRFNLLPDALERNSQSQPNRKPVLQLDKETLEIIASFSSARKAAKAVLGISDATHILECCNKKRRITGNFAWCFEEEYSSKKEIEPKIRVYTPRVIQVLKDGSEVIFESAAEASRATGINRSNITQCCRKKREKAGGFCWKYKN